MDPTKLKEYMDAIGQGLAPALDKIGQNFSTVFAWAMKNNYAQAWIDLSWPVLTGIILYPCYRWLKWGFTSIEKENGYRSGRPFDDSEGQAIFAVIVTGIFGLAFTVSLLAGIPSAVQRFVAPEFSTLQDIVAMFKSTK